MIERVGKIDRIGFKTVLSKGFYGVHELTGEIIDVMRDYTIIAPVHIAAYPETAGQFDSLVLGLQKIAVFEINFYTTIPTERHICGSPY